MRTLSYVVRKRSVTSATANPGVRDCGSQCLSTHGVSAAITALSDFVIAEGTSKSLTLDIPTTCRSDCPDRRKTTANGCIEGLPLFEINVEEYPLGLTTPFTTLAAERTLRSAPCRLCSRHQQSPESAGNPAH